jgi:hypothetical protein
MSKNENVKSMADRIYSSLTANETTITAAPDIYEQCLPAELTMDTVTMVRKQDGDFIAATASAVGKFAVAAMVKDSTVGEYTTKVSMGNKDSVSHTVQRSKTITNHFAKEGEPKELTKMGVVTTSVEYQHARNIGDLKAVKKEIAELALASFK